jgi:hypothetical protein
MQIDFSALASRVAAFSDVLGCIILSTDGMVLGAFPPGDEDGIKPAWLKFAALGEPERAFVRFSDAELWAYVQSGPYAAFAVATGNTRPGILLDHLEQALLVAGESRDQRAMARAPERVEILSGAKPKSVGATKDAASPAPEESERSPEPSEPTEPTEEKKATEEEPARPAFEETEVDRVFLARELAREFAGLLQEDHSGDEDKA